jgi:hypothetical protein
LTDSVVSDDEAVLWNEREVQFQLFAIVSVTLFDVDAMILDFDRNAAKFLVFCVVAKFAPYFSYGMKIVAEKGKINAVTDGPVLYLVLVQPHAQCRYQLQVPSLHSAASRLRVSKNFERKLASRVSNILGPKNSFVSLAHSVLKADTKKSYTLQNL